MSPDADPGDWVPGLHELNSSKGWLVGIPLLIVLPLGLLWVFFTRGNLVILASLLLIYFVATIFVAYGSAAIQDRKRTVLEIRATNSGFETKTYVHGRSIVLWDQVARVSIHGEGLYIRVTYNRRDAAAYERSILLSSEQFEALRKHPCFPSRLLSA